MSIGKRLLKLRRMSRREIGVRIREDLRRRRERRIYRRALAGANRAGEVCADGLPQAAVRLLPGARPDELKRLQADFTKTYDELAVRAAGTAQAVLSGSWTMLGHPFDLRADVDWSRDPRGEHRWPATFYADVPLGSPTDETLDVKYVWELARHQYLVELARGWLFTGEGQYATRARELMLDWIGENPVYEGVHWTSSLEVAMRAISWLWTVASLGEWEGWHDGDLARIANSLADHATYLENHLSFYSSPYNHLMGEATGLYLIGAWLEQLDQSARWRRRARQVLAEHTSRQFYDDGFTVEQATGYHFYTLGFLSLAVSAARTQGEPLEEVEAVLPRAYRAGVALRGPDGCWPAIGDLDSARSIPVRHEEFWCFDSLCSLGAVLFDDPRFRAPDTSAGQELYWLLGCSGVEKFKQLPKMEPPRHVVLKDSGYAVASQGGDWLLFDAGPLGDGLHADATPSTAHGHADTLQVLYSVGGKPVLIDGGMPFYNGSPEWIRHFRGPAAHNTLEIEGAAVARPAGRLDWSHVAPRPRLEANLSDDVWLARGSAEWAPGVRIERNLLGLPGRGLWIADWIETDRPRRVRWFWQMPAGTVGDVSDSAGASCLVRGEDITLAAWADSLPIRLQVENPRPDSPVGVIAPHYGSWFRGQRVCLEAEVVNQGLVVTCIGSAPVPVEVTIRGRRVACDVRDATSNGKQRPLAATCAEKEHDSEGRITWRVRIGEADVIYVGGAIVDSHGREYTIITGAGNWSALTGELSARTLDITR